MIDDDIEFSEIGVSPEERKKRREILDKTKGKDLVRGWQNEDRQSIEQKLAAHAPSVTIEKRCHVCVSPHRLWIEEMIVKGYAFTKIAESLPDSGIDRRSLSNHSKKHMPLERLRIREELEEEAQKLKKNYEDGASGVLTDRGKLRALTTKAFDEAMNGVIEIATKDLIQMIKLLNDMDVESAGTKAEETEMQLRIFGRAVQAVCDQPTLNAIVDEMKRLSKLDNVEFETEAAMGYRPMPIPDAEVVDESALPAIEQRSAESDRDSE